LLSLLDSFISSALFALIAVACLKFFFAEPLFSFYVDERRDILTIVTFAFTSLVVTALARRLRDLSDAGREQVRLLDLTHDAVFVRDLSGTITYGTRGAGELYGWPKGEAVGKTTQELLRTEFPIPVDEIMRVLVDAERWEGELLHTRRDGNQVAVASRW